jgi:DNA gyrase subunit A
VRLINLTKKNDTIASVCKVTNSQEEDVEYSESSENSENSENQE